MSVLEKRFLVVGAAGTALIVWVVRSVLGGIVYSTAAFFAGLFWDRWKSKRDR